MIALDIVRSPDRAYCAASHSAPVDARAFESIQTSKRIVDRQFLDMQRAFMPWGGMESGDEIVRRMRRQSTQPLSTLARWIVARTIVHLDVKAQILIPLFQFDLADMSLRPTASGATSELAGVFDDWELALWFAQPNAWLDGGTPASATALDDRIVLQAARADRFIARG